MTITQQSQRSYRVINYTSNMRNWGTVLLANRVHSYTSICVSSVDNLLSIIRSHYLDALLTAYRKDVRCFLDVPNFELFVIRSAGTLLFRVGPSH